MFNEMNSREDSCKICSQITSVLISCVALLKLKRRYLCREYKKKFIFRRVEMLVYSSGVCVCIASKKL